MLSHSANNKPEEAEVAPADSQMPEASGVQRRHLTVADVFGRFDRNYFRSWFIDGPRLLLTGRFTHREAAFIAISALPALLAVALITVPAYLFNTPQHNAFYHFGQFLKGENTSMIPMAFGAVASLLSFRFPHAP
ncbi:hypothetical protein OKA05_00815 [Luteolibacter arcticus]|uniref:Uncharacterized protein n=1 Tax=Luteolibacter arcticus TaxID=1581411 RepID=A0ABT3GBR8_9BACT|nr:hypothetical protein [Luteolibacter arcticus]MCW1921074.1 hypothetical protein [Luteolibacter arcticus]